MIDFILGLPKEVQILLSFGIVTILYTITKEKVCQQQQQKDQQLKKD